MISDGTVLCYDDGQIMDDLKDIYGASAPAIYAQLMKTACEAHKAGFFDEKFVELAQIDYSNISREEFLEKLKADCDAIGEGKNLGELKTYVLLQTLSIKLGEQIYVFCSDDKNARNGAISSMKMGSDLHRVTIAYIVVCKFINSGTIRLKDTDRRSDFQR